LNISGGKILFPLQLFQSKQIFFREKFRVKKEVEKVLKKGLKTRSGTEIARRWAAAVGGRDLAADC
jgi:hypothetical protein